MFEHILNEMAEAIYKEYPNLSYKEIKRLLKKCWENRIALVWNVDDIMTEAKKMQINLSTKEAQNVLKCLLYDHDCSVGVSWDTIQNALKKYKIDNLKNKGEIS